MIAFKVRLLKAAQSELHEAFHFYSEISPAWGLKFIECVDEAIESLVINPFFYAIRYGAFRLKIVPRFPYIIHFVVKEDERMVKIVGIRSMHRRPKQYKSP